MMGLDNPIHLAFLLIVVLLVFGAKRLPEMGHSLGTGLRGFKQAIGGEDTHTTLSVVEPEQSQTPAHAPATAAPIDLAPVAPAIGVKDDRAA